MRDEYWELRRSIGMLTRIDPQRYRVNIPLSEPEILGFERLHAITLPTDYRDFLLTMGNGGVGPGYGVEKLGQAYDVDWSENPGLVGVLAAPFPHAHAWNVKVDPALLIEDQYRQQDQYWHSRQVEGALPICHYGCNKRGILIVTGSERGHVWIDDRADWMGLYPDRSSSGERVTFLEWFRSWVETEDNRTKRENSI